MADDSTNPQQDDLDKISGMTVVAPSLHEQTLEQALLTPVVVQASERVTLKVFDILGNKRLRRIVRMIGKKTAVPGMGGRPTDLSQTTVFATAILHGFAIIEHENADLFKQIEAIHIETATTDLPMFEEMYGNLRAAANYGTETVCIHLASSDLETLADRASLLNISPSEFATACLLASMDGYHDIAPDVLKKINHKHTHFVYSCNVLLEFLKKCKY